MKKIFALTLAFVLLCSSALASTYTSIYNAGDKLTDDELLGIIRKFSSIYASRHSSDTVADFPILYSDQYITVTYEGIAVSGDDIKIHIVADNTSDLDIQFRFDSCVCNGWDIKKNDSSGSIVSKSHSKLRTDLMFYDGADMCGISSADEIETINYKVVTVNTSGYSRIFTGSEYIAINFK